ncbi:hypothetical protein CDL12_15540 [Handroanthus impetiginosus]|uniref:Uncharacterized protein n=1 Tax=Handroanthus impetiginosus TaxID=429701 RepID=A0A2G9H2V3_9LAMI|nr:hypothetical protein CDL12_15540 [Handroanthus impetiginosus]
MKNPKICEELTPKLVTQTLNVRDTSKSHCPNSKSGEKLQEHFTLNPKSKRVIPNDLSPSKKDDWFLEIV